MKVLLFGGTGMLGHIVKIVFEEAGHEVCAPSRDFYDVTMGIDALRERVHSYSPDYIVNCVGILVKASEENPDIARLVNSSFPHWLEEIMGPFHVIHASTDCVFSGDLLYPLTYRETDVQDAISVYGKTKAAGEISGTIRTSIIGPELKDGSGLFHWYMTSEGEVKGYTDHWWNGITTLEWARQALRVMERQERFGLLQIGLNKPINKETLLFHIKCVFGVPTEITPTAVSSCNRVLWSSIEVPTIVQQLDELRRFMIQHEYKYEQYREVLRA